jgi:hypothetical protein
VQGQDAHLGFIKEDLAFTTPVYQGEDEQWRFSSQASWLAMPNNATLPDSHKGVPQDLYDVRVGGGYGCKFEDGKVFGVNVTLGSASDRPFSGPGETAMSATAFMYWPHDDDSGWLTYLAGQTQLDGRSPYVFPGVGYYFTSEKLDALLGLPALWGAYKPTKEFTIQGLFIPSRVMVDATYTIHEGVRLFATYDWEWLNYILHDRTDQNDQFYYMEQRVYSGVEWDVAKNVELSVGLGYGFDRRFFQSTSPLFAERHDELSVDDGVMLFLKVHVKF